VPILITRVRIAESSPDFSKTILSSGRFVTHGIQFDVNSDQLRPESAPVLKMVADALAPNASLKLRIEGHTDSSGDAAKNLDLSKRRAESVKNALVTRYGIAADRLTTEGFGQTKPLSPNDTPQGKANNRRVEFVKM
jgi:outer membrane protein OmpA-like peptidoglycan-associated protein